MPQMCFVNKDVLRTLSKVPNPSLLSQRDWVSADGAAFHTQPQLFLVPMTSGPLA